MTKYYPIGPFIVKVDWHHHQLRLIQEDEKATRKKESGLEEPSKVRERKAKAEQRFTCVVHCVQHMKQNEKCDNLYFQKLKYSFSGLSLCQVFCALIPFSIANCSLFGQSERARSSVNSSILQQLSSQLMSNTPFNSV